MLFPTIDFAIFFAVAFTVNWLLNPYAGSWKLAMIALSYFFYGWVGWSYCLLLLATTAVAYTGGLWVAAQSQRARPAHRDGYLCRAAAGHPRMVQVLRLRLGQSRQRHARHRTRVAPSPCYKWVCPSPSPSSPSWRSATSSTSTAETSSRPSRSILRCTSRSSRISSPDQSCAASSCCPRSVAVATPTPSTTHAPSG